MGKMFEIDGVKLNSGNMGRCTNWAQVLWNITHGMVFYSLRLGLKGERMWVLSSVSYSFLTAHTDDFYHLLAMAQATRAIRYKDGGAKDTPEDIGYIIGYRGNPIIAVRRNGEILVNERAKSGDPRGAKAIARIVPELQSALTARPNLFNN